MIEIWTKDMTNYGSNNTLMIKLLLILCTTIKEMKIKKTNYHIANIQVAVDRRTIRLKVNQEVWRKGGTIRKTR